MNVLYVLVPLALVLAGAAVAAFRWAVQDGQFDDVETPALRVLFDDDPSPDPSQSGSPQPERSAPAVTPSPPERHV